MRLFPLRPLGTLHVRSIDVPLWSHGDNLGDTGRACQVSLQGEHMSFVSSKPEKGTFGFWGVATLDYTPGSLPHTDGTFVPVSALQVIARPDNGRATPRMHGFPIARTYGTHNTLLCISGGPPAYV